MSAFPPHPGSSGNHAARALQGETPSPHRPSRLESQPRRASWEIKELQRSIKLSRVGCASCTEPLGCVDKQTLVCGLVVTLSVEGSRTSYHNHNPPPPTKITTAVHFYLSLLPLYVCLPVFLLLSLTHRDPPRHHPS